MINKINLEGEWQLFLDKDKSETCETVAYNDTIRLPNSTSNAKKGEYNKNKEVGSLTDTYKFEGWAWYKKIIDTTGLQGNRAYIHLERTRVSTIFIDGEVIGTQDSLVSPHIYDITEHIKGKEQELVIRISNVDYKVPGGHLTSPDTQTNWNGIIGKMEIRIYNLVRVENLIVHGDTAKKSFHLTADVTGKESGIAKVIVKAFNGPLTNNDFEPVTKEFKYSDNKIDVDFPVGDNALLWSEHSPNLYEITLVADDDRYVSITGLRDFTAGRDKFLINGKKTFLRGKHDGMVFPKTGFAPCTLDEWLRVMEISKKFGINHYRFHTCCPPDAAFLAADMLGIYMEPELPFWGTITTPEDEGHNQESQDFLVEEGFKMLRFFGNHPSFCMMSLGNELWGSKEVLNDILGKYKSLDNRHLYTQGSNNFQWFPNVLENDDFFCGVRLANDRLIRGSYAMCDAPLGHVQTDRPSTMHDYDSIIKPKTSEASSTEADEEGYVMIQYGTTMKRVKASEADASFIPEVPIVTHEIGQYQTYPNFDEINKYTGSIKARNFEHFRDDLEKAGLKQYAKDYFTCSGALAMKCYKEELEAVFRSRELAGFQILDIQDFPGQGTALVGALDAFMDNKGLITDSEWRSFCSDAVLLARFPKYIYTCDEEFKAHIELAYYRDESIDGKTLVWTAQTSSSKTISSGEVEIKQNGDENYVDICDISFEIPDVISSRHIDLHFYIKDTDINKIYRIYIYPEVSDEDLKTDKIFKSADDEKAKKYLANGETILVCPDLSTLKNTIDGFYCQDFWCYPMFKTISNMMDKPEPIGTMGLLISDYHPALSAFLTKKYSTYPWWGIVENAKCEILDDCYQDKNIIVRTIDNFQRNHHLSFLYEYKKGKGKVLVCNVDLKKIKNTPEGRMFIYSLIRYIK